MALAVFENAFYVYTRLSNMGYLIAFALDFMRITANTFCSKRV
jgi:hypothetical protein